MSYVLSNMYLVCLHCYSPREGHINFGLSVRMSVRHIMLHTENLVAATAPKVFYRNT